MDRNNTQAIPGRPLLPPDFLEALRQPFAPGELRLRVGSNGRQRKEPEGWECLAIPVIPRLVIEARLDALAPGNWSTTSPSLVVASDRLVVGAQVTIGELTHTDYGEILLKRPVVPDEVEELLVSVPEAFEYAFILVCARFGIGRYLDTLAREWLPYDPQRGCIALSPRQQQEHIRKLYQQANILKAEPPTVPPHSGHPPLPRSTAPTASSTFASKEHLRANDLAWVREQCAAHPRSLEGILRNWHVRSLEQLSDAQLTEVINAIHRSRAKSTHAS